MLVPKDVGFGISLPLFAQVDDAHVNPLSYEYSQDIAVPQEMYGDHCIIVDEADGVRMFIESWELKDVEV